MNAKRFLRGPLFWILLAVLLVLVGSSLVSGIGGPERIDTSQAVEDIQADRVEKAVITETVFNIPGLGRLTVDAVLTRVSWRASSVGLTPGQ